MGRPFNTVQLNAPPQASDINRIQANISSAFNSVSGPFIGGTLLTGITLTASTPMAINHGLGRQPQIWVVCDITNASIPSASSSVSISPSPYTPAGTISGSTFTGTPQSFSASATTAVSAPIIFRTDWNSNSITLEAGADCTISLWVN